LGEVIIRPAVPDDVPALRAITAAAYLPYLSRIGRAPAPVSSDYAAAVERGEVWVAAADEGTGLSGELVGLIVLVRAPDYLLLENVAVLPAAQGRGVGSRLLEFAESQAAELGLPEIRLYTNVAMTENLVYYPRRGYVETHRREEDGYRRVYFCKPVRHTG